MKHIDEILKVANELAEKGAILDEFEEKMRQELKIGMIEFFANKAMYDVSEKIYEKGLPVVIYVSDLSFVDKFNVSINHLIPIVYHEGLNVNKVLMRWEYEL